MSFTLISVHSRVPVITQCWVIMRSVTTPVSSFSAQLLRITPGYRWLWFQAIIGLPLNNWKRGGGKSQRCQGGRKMDASVLSIVRLGGVRGRSPLHPPPPPHTHTHFVDDGPLLESYLARWLSNKPWHVLFPWISAEAFECVCVPHVCAFHAKQPGSSYACQLLADLLLKRMCVVCLCGRVNLWIRSDWKT